MVTDLHGRLACACNLAYDINGSGVLGPIRSPQVYFEGSGFEVDPETVVGGPCEINACRVGVTPDGIVVAFRGTLPPIPDFNFIDNVQFIKDWSQNFNLELENVPWLSKKKRGARLHGGFAKALDSLWRGIVSRVDRLSEAAGPPRLLFTGHSKGGALAAIAALRWVIERDPKYDVKVVTFGAPYAGNTAFAQFYDQQEAINHDRFEFGDDLVPHLPFLDGGLMAEFLQVVEIPINPPVPFDYSHVGTLWYVDRTGQPLGSSNHLEDDRRRWLAERLAFDKIGLVTDHFVWCTGGAPGYLNTVTLGELC